MLHSTLSVFRFELRRTLTLSRIAVWLLLTSFPIFIVGVIKYNEASFEPEVFGGSSARRQMPEIVVPLDHGGTLSLKLRQQGAQRVAQVAISRPGSVRRFDNVVIPGYFVIPNNVGLQDRELVRKLARGLDGLLAEQSGTIQELPPGEDFAPQPTIPDTAWGLILFGLIPEVITLFGLLLWVTPVVQAELEGRTWIYLAVRPRGRVSTLLGKYLTAITWTALSGWVSTTVCVWVAGPVAALRLWWTIVVLIGLACLAYGSLYSLIGVFLHRRAMVIAVAYTLIFEFLVSFVPAVINQFTVQYRLRNLLVDFMGWRDLFSVEAGGILLGNQPPWLHIVILLAATIGLLVFAAQVIQRKEYATVEEG